MEAFAMMEQANALWGTMAQGIITGGNIAQTIKPVDLTVKYGESISDAARIRMIIPDGLM